MSGIADAGFIIAFCNRRDAHHGWAVAQAKLIREPLLTCESVLSEASYNLRNSAMVLDLIQLGMLRLGFELAENEEAVLQLANRYADREPDLADLCLVRMSELNPKLSVWTVDSDFLVYRRNGRQVIPVVMPPTTRK